MFEGVPDVFTAKDARHFRLVAFEHGDLLAHAGQKFRKGGNRLFFFSGAVGFCLGRIRGFVFALEKGLGLLLRFFFFLGDGVFRDGRGGIAEFYAFDRIVDDLNGALKVRGFAQKVEFELCGGADDARGRGFVAKPGQLDDDPVFPLFLDHRFGDPEAVDAVFNNRIGTLENVAGGLFGKVRPVDFQDKTHAALDIESEVDDLLEDVRVRRGVFVLLLRAFSIKNDGVFQKEKRKNNGSKRKQNAQGGISFHNPANNSFR